MISMSRFLAVVLTGLALVKGDHALAAEQFVLQGSGAQTAPKGVYQTGGNVARPRATAPGKTSVGIQDQVPVSSKGTPTGKCVCIADPVPVSSKGKSSGKSVGIQNQAPVTSKGTLPGRSVGVEDPVPVASKGVISTGKSSVGIQDQVPVSSKGATVGKSASTQSQTLGRSRFIVKDTQSLQMLQQ